MVVPSIGLNTGFFLGTLEFEAGVSEMDLISLLADEDLLRERPPPVSLVSCFISLRRWKCFMLDRGASEVRVVGWGCGGPGGGSGRRRTRGLGIRSCARSPFGIARLVVGEVSVGGLGRRCV